MNNVERSWMYERLDGQGGLYSRFVTGVDEFSQFACFQPNRMSGDKKHQGKRDDISETSYGNALHGGGQPIFEENLYRQMILDAAGPNFSHSSSWQSYSNSEPESSHPFQHSMEEDPNPVSKKIYDLLDVADTELYPGSSLSQLAVVSRMLNIKMENNMSKRGYNQIMQLLKESLPEDNIVLDNYYQTKKLVRSLGLPVEKIDCCESGCILYWGDDDGHLTSCKFFSKPRYKRCVGSCKRKLVPYKRMYYFPLIPRLQRLYASYATAANMRWHHEHKKKDGVMRHPSDFEAWKHSMKSGRKYSSWPVIVTPYNLPPVMCMKEAYMFLTIIVPGPSNPKHKIDVYLQPLIKELTLLWETGVEAFDISKRQNFQLRAALIWTISDFPAYSMLSGWSTAGKLACPYCIEETQSFRLQHGRKQSWFDCHRMFLDQHHPFRRDQKNFLKGQTIRRPPPKNRTGEEILDQICNLAIINVTELDAEQKNFFDNVFNNVLNFDDKTKDNPQSRLDTKKYCDRPQSGKDSNGQYPKVVYTLDKEAKAILFNWVKCLKFPDGYVSNLGRLPDTNAKRLFGMKSHDGHVFMQRLMPIAFRELLPSNVCEKSSCALPYEARVAGPVQYRWMYPFERYLGTLRKMIMNKANLKGNLSIFSRPGRLWGEAKKRDLILAEIKAAQTYILLNCEEVEPFVRLA
ncbi:hypothetical protein P3S68_004428 [Capsicum galapagoense]